MREWRNLLLNGQPLYEEEQKDETLAVELKRQEILDDQDLAEYKVGKRARTFGCTSFWSDTSVDPYFCRKAYLIRSCHGLHNRNTVLGVFLV